MPDEFVPSKFKNSYFKTHFKKNQKTSFSKSKQIMTRKLYNVTEGKKDLELLNQYLLQVKLKLSNPKNS